VPVARDSIEDRGMDACVTGFQEVARRIMERESAQVAGVSAKNRAYGKEQRAAIARRWGK